MEMLSSTPKKLKWRIKDNTTWKEAFFTFSFILVLYLPNQWTVPCQYKLLILRTHCQFSEWVSLAYDQVFRKHTAAINGVDWSTINIQLFNFHAAGASIHDQSGWSANSSEPQGTSPLQFFLPVLEWGMLG